MTMRARAALGALAGDFLPDPSRHVAEDPGVRVVGVGDGDRSAAVGGFADLQVERHLAEELSAEPPGRLAGAAVREDLAAAAGAMLLEEILHDPENGTSTSERLNLYGRRGRRCPLV